MKFLVGFAGSNACRDALNVAIEHTKAFNALVYVVTSMYKAVDEDQAQIDQAYKELEDVKNKVEERDVPCEIHLLIQGMSPGESLVRFAKENDIKENFLGVRRRSKLGKMLFGFNAQYVILNAHCSVVSVR